MTFGSSNQVDSRVVELKFNNQQFENNAKKSLSTLERLKKALDFSKSRPVFTDISPETLIALISKKHRDALEEVAME